MRAVPFSIDSSWHLVSIHRPTTVQMIGKTPGCLMRRCRITAGYFFALSVSCSEHFLFEHSKVYLCTLSTLLSMFACTHCMFVLAAGFTLGCLGMIMAQYLARLVGPNDSLGHAAAHVCPLSVTNHHPDPYKNSRRFCCVRYIPACPN